MFPVAVAAAFVLGLVPSSGAAAGAGYGFSPAVEVSAPSNASQNPNGFLHGVSCTSPGDCTSVGNYEDSSGHQQAMAATETGDKWARASEVSAPANSYGNPDATLTGISCASTGNCTAVGLYKNSSGSQEAMAATEAGGKWARAAELSLPAGTAKDPFAELRAVSCTSSGNCTAVGSYSNSSHTEEPMVATEAGGKWGKAAELSLPATAGTGNTAIATLFQVSCTSAGNCTAVGLYSDSSHERLAMVATEAGGKWGAAAEFDSLPSGASGSWASLYGVWCTSAGNCAAVGAYLGSSDSTEAMVANEAGGKWGRASELTLPPGANTEAPNGDLEAVSCTSAGNCAAFGVYSTAASYSLDMVATETSGKWGRAAKLSPPSGSRGANTFIGGSGNGVSCTSKGFCTAVGSYGDSSGISQAMAAAGTV